MRTQLLWKLRDKYKLHAVPCEHALHGISISFDRKRLNLQETEEFAEGHFEVQDEGSQLAADLADVAPGDCVLDLCAGGGGKGLAIAHKMRGRGVIYVHDVREHSLEQARKRYRRAGVTNVQFVHSEPEAYSAKLDRLKGRADWVIADVPCTGTGTLRRNPDLRHRFSEELLAEKVRLQEQILRASFSYLGARGRLLYITCSLLREENENQVAKLVARSPLKLVTEMQILPGTKAAALIDGFYAAVLKN